MVFYNFDKPKYEVEKEILRVIKEDSSHKIPAKWKNCNQGDYFERIYIYFKDGPEELYQIGFTGDSTDWNHSSGSRLSLIGQFSGKWKFERDLDQKEIDRITKRVESEILSKIKFEYYKTD